MLTTAPESMESRASITASIMLGARGCLACARWNSVRHGTGLRCVPVGTAATRYTAAELDDDGPLRTGD